VLVVLHLLLVDISSSAYFDLIRFGVKRFSVAIFIGAFKRFSVVIFDGAFKRVPKSSHLEILALLVCPSAGYVGVHLSSSQSRSGAEWCQGNLIKNLKKN
jgi:hypothetical protein